MLLAIDVGNTNTVCALHDGKDFVADWRCNTESVRTADQYFVWLRQLMQHHGLDPAECRWPPTSLLAETGAAPEFEAALEVLADRLDHWLGIGDFTAVRAAWLARASHIGQRIEVRLPNQTFSGIFEDVGADGTLVLRTPQGTRRIAAADIHFPE